MHDFAEYLVQNQVLFFPKLGVEPTAYLLMLVVGGALLGLFLTAGGGLTYVERKIAGWTQRRIGPNRVGPFGLLQFTADGIKLILKEDIIPAAVDKPLFKLAPYAVVGGAFMVMVVLPLGPNLIASNLDIGLLVYLAASSFVTMGIVMSGWASQNKWSTMGAARSVAQIVSYEIPIGLSLLPLVLLTGSLSFQSFAQLQGAYPWQWSMFHNPGLFLSTFCYFIAAIAEINRTPFDIPEAESELVSGYNTEYSGIRFGMFFAAEFANVLVISMITVVCFMGAWHFPGENWFLGTYFAGEHPTLVGALQQHNFGAFALYQLLGHVALLLKSGVLVVLIILLRWTLPRVRVDQLMSICWKYLVPMTVASSVVTAAWMIIPGTDRFTYRPGASMIHGNACFYPLFVFMLFCLIKAQMDSKYDSKPAHRGKNATAGKSVLEEARG